MTNVLHALFDSSAGLESAEREATGGAPEQRQLEFVHHRARLRGERVAPAMAHASSGVLYLGLASAALGAMAGVVGAATGVLPLSIIDGATIVGILGTGAGGFAGIFVGTSVPEPPAERLGSQEHTGSTRVTVTAPSMDARDRVERIFRRHGAVIGEAEAA